MRVELIALREEERGWDWFHESTGIGVGSTFCGILCCSGCLLGSKAAPPAWEYKEL